MTMRPFLSARRSLALTAVAMLCVAACSGGSEEATITTPAETTTTTDATTTTAVEAVTETTTEATTTTVAPSVIRQPLTGEPLASEADFVERPAMAVKIDNHPGARRNHSGLAVADIVFEEKVEGSLTRFAAVLHTQDADPLGPIRSGREQDVALLSSFNEPLFAWSGGNPGVTALVRSSSLVDLGAPSYPGSYYRGPGSGPHNLYSDSGSLYSLTPEGHPGAPPVQFGYLDDGQVFAGAPGRNVSFSIGSIDIEWTWNDEEQRYERSQEGEAHVEPVGVDRDALHLEGRHPGPLEALQGEGLQAPHGPAPVGPARDELAAGAEVHVEQPGGEPLPEGVAGPLPDPVHLLCGGPQDDGEAEVPEEHLVLEGAEAPAGVIHREAHDRAAHADVREDHGVGHELWHALFLDQDA